MVPFPIIIPPTADRSGAKAADGPLWWPLVSGTELSRCAGGRALRGANEVRDCGNSMQLPVSQLMRRVV